MKKKLSLLAAGLMLLVLPACGPCCKKKQKPCVEQPCTQPCPEQPKRISGPLAEKEVGWEKEDYA